MAALRATKAALKAPDRKALEVKASGSKLELAIYGDIEPDGYDWWTDEVIPSETSARYFKEVLDSYAAVSEIDLYINSLGGYVTEGNAIYTMLKRHPATVHVYIDAFACSMASSVAMAGDKVTMSPNALMMVHNPATVAEGNAAELRKVADDLDVMAEAFRQTYLLKAGDKLTEDKLIALLDAETYLTAKQCQEYGLCDEIENVPDETAQELATSKAEIARLTALLEAKNEEPKQEPAKKTGWFFK